MKREERKVLRPSPGVGSWSKFVVGSSFGPNLLVEKNSFGDLLRLTLELSILSLFLLSPPEAREAFLVLGGEW